MTLQPLPGVIIDAKHSHQCSHCGYVWMCYDQEWAMLDFEKCKVTKATKVNHSGPFCLLCYHLAMAIRVAANRKLKDLECQLLQTQYLMEKVHHQLASPVTDNPQEDAFYNKIEKKL